MLTQGELKKQEQLLKQEEAKAKKAQEKRLQELKKTIDAQMMGAFKDIIINSFIKQFAENYDNGLDYNTLLRAFTFGKAADGVSPYFSFNENMLEFKSDTTKERIAFNDNLYVDFVSNDEIIAGDYLTSNWFNSKEEYEAYQTEAYNKTEFVPTILPDNERYNEYNRINKLYGYQPVNMTVKNATQLANNEWTNSKAKVLANINKKLKV